jgi:prefoldin subunit 5
MGRERIIKQRTENREKNRQKYRERLQELEKQIETMKRELQKYGVIFIPTTCQ